MSTPAASNTSALPDLPVAARLPCFATVIPAAAATNAQAVETLKKTGKDAVPALIEALQDQNTDVRGSVGFVLGEIGRDAVPALTLALQDEDWNIRYSAREVLGKIGTPEALKAIKDFQ